MTSAIRPRSRTDMRRRRCRLHDTPCPAPDTPIESARLRPRTVETRTLTDGGDGSISPTLASEELRKVGRYQIRRKLGAGGMGVVFLAFDPELSREVAVKIVRPEHGRRGPAMERFRREARSLARLSHPNIVQLFDVGVEGDCPYFVMEFVPGIDMKAWLRTGPPIPERVRVLLQAGRGLAAAHQAEILHRDFKPGNVLLTEEAVAKVGDFGIARAFRHSKVSKYPAPTALESGADLRETITHHGAVVGSPAYMSPEQQRGEVLSPRSDQFSFCVLLYEALTGVRPFRGPSMGRVMDEKEVGLTQAHFRDLPRRYAAVLRRGLAPLPSDRYDSMALLLRDLEGHSKRHRLWWPGAALVAAVSLGAGLWGGDSGPKPCDEVVEDRLAFSVFTRTAVLQAQANGQAPAGSPRVLKLLDAHRVSWSETNLAACALDDELASEARLCLADSAMEFKVAVRDATMGGQPSETLAAPQECLDPRRLQSGHRLPPHDEQARLKEVRRCLNLATDAFGARDTLAVGAGVARAEAAVEALQGTHSEALARAWLAELKDDVGFPADGAKEYQRAFRLATSRDDPRVAAVAAVGLVWVMTMSLEDFDAGRRWLHEADVLIARTMPSDALLITRGIAAAALFQAKGSLPESRIELERARDIVHRALRRSTGAAEAKLLASEATIAFNLGALAYWEQSYEQALEEFERSRILSARARGLEDLRSDAALEAIGQLQLALGRPAAALRTGTEHVELIERWATPTDARLIYALSTVAGAAQQLGEPDKARQALERAVAIAASQPNPIPEDVAMMKVGLAGTMIDLGELESAAPLLTEAADVYEQLRDPALAVRRSQCTALQGLLASEYGEHQRAADLWVRARVALEGSQVEKVQRATLSLVGVRILTTAGELDKAVELARDLVDGSRLGDVGTFPEALTRLIIALELRSRKADMVDAGLHRDELQAHLSAHGLSPAPYKKMLGATPAPR